MESTNKLKILAALLCIITSCKTSLKEDVTFIESEIDYRLEKIVARITHGEIPRITKDFLLAGLTLDPEYERRFTNYSGDQAGRYLSAMSLTDPDGHSIEIHDLVWSVIENQKSDGRYGADTLEFDPGGIDGPQMALLWGNGRLLNGLLDYYEKYPDRQEALESAERLAEFLEDVTWACTRPEIIDRFKSMGALGFICFTQITEGMVKLYNATGNEKYIQIAETVYPLLPDFGNQHSHGFLNTLRGVVMLYQATKNRVHLEYAEEIFDRIINSENYMITGGVPEFFGQHDITEHSRDEGCSEADFFILCLQLWEATGNIKYLDKGEYLFMNHMLFNQFLSGDFGHHVIREGFGFTTSHAPGQSWWCCNYHGLHALHDARNAVVTRKGPLRMINMFYPIKYFDEHINLIISKLNAGKPSFRITVESIEGDDAGIAVRDPYWSSNTDILVNGQFADVRIMDGYMVIENNLNRGDIIEIILDPVLRIADNNRNEIDLTQLSSDPVSGVLIYGPWLMSVDDVYQNQFMTELSYNNIVYLPEEYSESEFSVHDLQGKTFNPEAYLSFEFLKEGTSQTGRVILRPLSEVSFQSPSNVRFWMNFAKKPADM